MLVMIKVCEAARINYSEMIKFVRRECKCKSKVCLNWECTCMVDDETGELGDCVCPPCDCPSCISCQVYTIFHIRKSKLIIDMFHPSYLRFFSNIDGANVQISFLFWVF